jgi:Ni/Fe-hydrogenase subunit HybB-like protein
MNRVQNTKMVLWLITGFAAAVGITRFIFGLGATTNLSDATPWGLWIGFDVMGGVALAAGGFVLTAIVYIMKRDKFHPLVRPAVLTAFLGYLAVIFGLLFDLGLPWNIWHMMIYWNPHSPLFEVGWCVMLYTTVLLLEFSPVPLESTSRYARVRKFLMKFRFLFVLLGIMLSTLHQSSLGSLFLIMPFKLYPLWYSNILPIQFFISAVALGLMMVSLESLVSHWLYRRPAAGNLVAGLGKAAVWVLSIYLIVKMSDIAITGKLGLIFAGTWESFVFIIELLISVIIPLVIFAVPRSRNSKAGQWIGSFMVVFGMVFYRINVGGLTMLRATGETYIPSFMEIAVSAGVVSVAGLVFLFAVEKFHIWEKRPVDPQSLPHTMPGFDRASEVWLGTPAVAARTKYSLAFVLSLALGFAVMPGHKIHSEGIEDVPAQKARGGDVLFVDGNRDGYGVAFKHADHAKRLGQEQSCVKCHHMNIPMDRQSGCYECHKHMYVATDVFDHEFHTASRESGLECAQCHPRGLDRQAATAKKCDACHTDLIPEGAAIKFDSNMAPSYTDAMHTLCLDCHRKKAPEVADHVNLTLCTTCHETAPPNYLTSGVAKAMHGPYFNHVVIPGVGAPAEGI